ncbi:Amino-acid acetyltransferase [compost metagenome]|uniref:GNAT family N-acetyltransferase n=1 Tax=Cupriavidus necator TaxID=106590 RepID=UPI003ED097F6
MPPYLHLRLASLADLPQIAALLEQCRLTTDGVAEIIDSFHVAHSDSRIIGCAAAERHGESIVIRSVAVEPASRDRGVATRLVDALLMRARGTDVRHAVLLSESAPAYFARWGFSLIPADKAPSDARASSEFQGAPPTSALCMHCELR